MKLASCKSALTPPVVYSTDRSKAVVPVLVLLFVALWFILRGNLLYVFPCVILFLCFLVLLVCDYLAWGRERVNLSVFRTFVQFVLVWICQFPLPLGVREGLRFVIVALPGVFSYLFFRSKKDDLLSHLVTVYEIWVHYYEPENKAQSRQSVGPGSPRPKKFKTQSSSGKVMGCTRRYYVGFSSTITGAYYANLLG